MVTEKPQTRTACQEKKKKKKRKHEGRVGKKKKRRATQTQKPLSQNGNGTNEAQWEKKGLDKKRSPWRKRNLEVMEKGKKARPESCKKGYGD